VTATAPAPFPPSAPYYKFGGGLWGRSILTAISTAPDTLADLLPGPEARGPAHASYAELLRGKRVALVGPADTTGGKGAGALIDSHDLVVRINRQWPVEEKLAADIGRRMDLLYHCCSERSPLGRLKVPEFAATRFAWYEDNRQTQAFLEICRDYGVAHASYQAFRTELARILDTVPNTGTLAIAHLLTTDLASLYVTGFSFYWTPYYDGYLSRDHKRYRWRWWRPHPKSVGGHQFEPQRRYFQALCAADPRIEVDAALKTLARRWRA
jgi:hypothetical protein